MKKLFPLLTIVIFLVVSCNNDELEQLKQENRDLKTRLEQRNADVQNFMEVFNNIEENLAEVRNRQQSIIRNSGSSETGKDRVAAVQNDIRAIDDLMQKNRENLNNLSQKLKTSKGANNELQRMVTNLKDMIDRKDHEIVSLVGQLDDLNYEVQDLYTSISELQTENAQQESVINLQEQQLNTAHFVIGSARDLKDKGIITREGGFIGIGRVEKLSEDFKEGQFKKIDIREKTVFPIDAKKINLVTTHPSDSYIVRKTADGKRYNAFEITRPQEFWKSSKYMVLVLD